MNIELTRSPDELREQFRALQCPADIAAMLEVSYRDLNYWIYRTPEKDRYTSFHIAKKSGASRQIDAPNPNIKILQQKLNTVLQTVYQVKPSAHGFASGKSVKTNADQHTKKRWVFNIDLDNFFHSIHFGRVRGMFMGKPYNLPPRCLNRAGSYVLLPGAPASGRSYLSHHQQYDLRPNGQPIAAASQNQPLDLYPLCG